MQAEEPGGCTQRNDADRLLQACKLLKKPKEQECSVTLTLLRDQNKKD